MMKKILGVIFLFIVLILFYFYKYDGFLGKGSYFLYYSNPNVIKSKKNKDFIIGDIIKEKYDDRYVIFIRIPVIFYQCKNSNPIIYKTDKEYVILDKKMNKVYATKSYSKYKKKIKQMGIKLYFNSEDIKRANLRIKVDKNIDIGQCKKLYNIPIIYF